jgi:opacity protein-like surface antigen
MTTATLPRPAEIRERIKLTREELAATNAKLQNLNDRYNRFKNGSLFGNSGFYIGLGAGAAFTNGTLRDIGYESAPQLMIPIGWQKYGNLLGIRTEWSAQRLEGVQVGSFFNPDPTVFSGTAMLTLSFPINSAKTNTIYAMGGGGFYMFKNIGTTSALADKFSNSLDDSDTETKWGFNAGAGLQFHVLGATSLFVQTSWTNVAADEGTSGEEGRNLRWMPVVIGFVLR